MSTQLRKLALAVHLTVSVGWVGAVVAYIALGIAADTTRDEQTVRAAWIAMDVMGWYAIVPLAIASFLTGLVMALGTKWGLVRHYWVMFSLVMTAFSTVILLLHMPTVSSTAAVARTADGERLYALGGDLFHPSVGLVILLLVLFLNIYKPRGMTRYGQRKQRQDGVGRQAAGVL